LITGGGQHWLPGRLAEFSGRDAIVDGQRTLTYAQLGDHVAAWRRVLEDKGVSPGAVVAVRGDYSPAICALLLAVVFRHGIVATLPVDEDPRVYLQAAHAEALFNFADGNGWSYSSLTPGPPPPLLERLRDRAAAGLVVFTSGTTARGKAALFDFETLVERYRPMRPNHRTLVFLLLDHLGGIHTMLHTLAHGGTLVIGRARRPDDVARTIERHRVELLPTTPTFLRMLVMSRGHERHDLSSLRLITYGTEPMPASTLESLRRAFPGVSLKQTYGLTELGVLPTRSRASGSLWLEVGGLGCQARIVDGVLWVRSDTAMLGYLNAPSPFDEDGWYNTHDAVEVDGPYVRILGRTTDLINVGGQKVYPSEVENVLLEMDNICEATVWGKANSITGQVVAARVTLDRAEVQDSLERRVDRFCRGRLAAYKIPVVVEIVDGDHHGQRFKKIRPGATEVATVARLASA
jgi:acyl-CoA synthetase (AMP-forming)/AMP-acid ligase II